MIKQFFDGTPEPDSELKAWVEAIQEISGHRNLEQLQQYLEIQPEQLKGAHASLSMLSPVENPDKIARFPDNPTFQSLEFPPWGYRVLAAVGLISRHRRLKLDIRDLRNIRCNSFVFHLILRLFINN